MYHVAAYLRLSREDGEAEGCRTESNSIRSQREMLLSYIRNQKDMKLYDIYVDDGWSGVNFQRPGFERMMRDIREGRVNCVIVKDLSRFGRDYIEAGRLIQRTFPAFSVRFIALTDDFDSLTADYNAVSMVLPVKNFVNDSYSRDISVKVRSHQRVKREQGEFIGAFCAYGYQKSRSDRHVLVPDAYAASIVRLIFAWKLEGYSCSGIAIRLQKLGVLSPMEHKRWNGEHFQTGFMTGIQPEWSAAAVKRILENEIYIGTMVQGRAEKINYKIRESRRKPKEEWIRVEHTHKAVIPEEDYKLVQTLLQTDSRAVKGTKRVHRYAGILVCGDCLKPMVRRINRYKDTEMVHYICSTHNRGGDCGRHDIQETDLDEAIMTGLQSQIAAGMEQDRVIARLKKAVESDEELWSGGLREHYGPGSLIEIWKRETERLGREREQYSGLHSFLQEDVTNHVISEEEYHFFYDIYEKQYNGLGMTLERQKAMLPLLIQSAAQAEERLEHMKREPGIWTLDRVTLLTFIKRIRIYEDRRICVELRCRKAGGK